MECEILTEVNYLFTIGKSVLNFILQLHKCKISCIQQPYFIFDTFIFFYKNFFSNYNVSFGFYFFPVIFLFLLGNLLMIQMQNQSLFQKFGFIEDTYTCKISFSKNYHFGSIRKIVLSVKLVRNPILDTTSFYCNNKKR